MEGFRKTKSIVPVPCAEGNLLMRFLTGIGKRSGKVLTATLEIVLKTMTLNMYLVMKNVGVSVWKGGVSWPWN
jgi:hypothetical protein